jgi:hypothetical protein
MADQAPSFERDVRPLFREGDRTAMLSTFDLWSYDDVARHADAILRAVATGSMPCDASWDADRVATFRRWSEQGKSA